MHDKSEKYWCAFARLTKTSSAFVNLIYSRLGSIELCWNAEPYDLWKIEGIQKNSVNAFISERKTINPDESIEYIKSRNIDFIHPEDERYPKSLKNIYNPPIGLFMKGSLEGCNLERSLAVVGSRCASENAKVSLGKILAGFAFSDVCIISGMAEGIDTKAHKCALENNLKTIAVIGGGFDKIYPKSNKYLFEKIIDGNGAVLTEYWPDSDALSWHFPVRNRIVSGLSKGVLIAEAALKSGAMITAKLALEQGKELMCMPGLISNPNTEGIYKLLKTGASMVTCTQDILDAMNWRFEKVTAESKTSSNDNLSDDERLVADLLKKDSLNAEELLLKTGLNINNLMVILTKLELEGIISLTNSDRYCAVD